MSEDDSRKTYDYKHVNVDLIAWHRNDLLIRNDSDRKLHHSVQTASYLLAAFITAFTVSPYVNDSTRVPTPVGAFYLVAVAFSVLTSLTTLHCTKRTLLTIHETLDATYSRTLLTTMIDLLYARESVAYKLSFYAFILINVTFVFTLIIYVAKYHFALT